MSEMNTKPVKITGIKFFTFSIIKNHTSFNTSLTGYFIQQLTRATGYFIKN